MKEKIREAYNVVLHEIWTFEDLKKMEDPMSPVYKLAVSYGISNGLACGFHKDLMIFKPEWHTSHSLINLGQM